METDLYETLVGLVQDEGLTDTLECLLQVLRDSEAENDERDNAAIPHLEAAIAAVRGGLTATPACGIVGH